MSIQDDIRAQQINIDKMGRAGEKQQNLVASLYKQFQDVDTAKAAADVMLTRQALKKMELVAAKYQDREIQDKARIAISQGQAQLADKIQAFQAQSANMKQKQLKDEAGIANTQNRDAMGVFQMNQRAALARANAFNGKLKPGKQLPKGVIENLANYESGLLDVRHGRNLFEKYAKGRGGAVMGAFAKLIPATDAAIFDQMGSNLANKLALASGQRISDEDIIRYQAMVPQPDDSINLARAKLADLDRTFKQDIRIRIKRYEDNGYNVDPYKELVARNKVASKKAPRLTRE